MKKFILFLLCLAGMFLGGFGLSANAAYYGVGYGGGYGYSGGYHGGYGGGYYQRPVNYNRDNSYYSYRPVQPVTPAMTRNNTVPPQTLSCQGTASYIRIGQNVMPCESAAATRIRQSSAKPAKTYNNVKTYNQGMRKVHYSHRKMPKIQYSHQKMPKLSKNSGKNID